MKFEDVKRELINNPYGLIGRLPHWDEGVWVKAINDASARRGTISAAIETFLVLSKTASYGFEVYFPSSDDVTNNDWEVCHLGIWYQNH